MEKTNNIGNPHLFGLSTLSEDSLPWLPPMLLTDISVQLSGADNKFLHTGST